MAPGSMWVHIPAGLYGNYIAVFVVIVLMQVRSGQSEVIISEIALHSLFFMIVKHDLTKIRLLFQASQVTH